MAILGQASNEQRIEPQSFAYSLTIWRQPDSSSATMAISGLLLDQAAKPATVPPASTPVPAVSVPTASVAAVPATPTPRAPRDLPLLIQGLLERLPQDGKWKRSQAENWLKMANLALEVAYEIEDDAEHTPGFNPGG